jgi:prophage antirepressor-like protein
MRKSKTDFVHYVLADLCEQLGFSLATRHPEVFEDAVERGAKAFAEAVLIEEGLNPQENRKLAQQTHIFVSEHFERWAREN